MKRTENVAVLEKALDLLECLMDDGDQTVAELSNSTGIAKGTAYRILSTLERRGYAVTYQRVRRYSVGSAFRAYAADAQKPDILLEIVRPAMRWLWELTGETVNMGVLARGKVLYLDVLESTQGLRATSRPGGFDAVHCTALGKAILSRLPPRERRAILENAQLVQHTKFTVTDRSDLESSIDRAASLGWAVDDQENEIGMRCVSAPILNGDGWPVAALSVSAPSTRLPPEAIENLGRTLMGACRRVGEMLTSPADQGLEFAPPAKI